MLGALSKFLIHELVVETTGIKAPPPWIVFVRRVEPCRWYPGGATFWNDYKPRYDFDHSKYMPHQGSKEKARRIAQMERFLRNMPCVIPLVSMSKSEFKEMFSQGKA